MKIGDVNGSAQANGLMPAEARNAEKLFLDADNKSVKAGELVELSLTSNDLIAGFQFALNYGSLELSDINFGLIKEENIGIHQGYLTVSWNDVASKSLEGISLISFEFVAQEDGLISDFVSLNSSKTKAEAYNNGQIHELGLSFEGEVASTTQLFQNEPNPFKGQTEIRFDLAEAGKATLTVSDVAGNQILVIERDYPQGANSEFIQLNGHKGVLYYSLKTDKTLLSKKMIILE